MEKLYKVCTNKGNKRIWIEGQILNDHQFTYKTNFDKTINNDEIVLRVVIGGKPQHTVSGNPKRPIIDLCGKYVTAFFGDATQYKAKFWGNEITITKGSE
jgi:hypothetical protein